MKTSVSVPDDLWDKVKAAGDGPSAVVQQALIVLADKLADPMSHAPSKETRERVGPLVNKSAGHFHKEVAQMLDQGYELGVALTSALDFFTLESLPPDVSALAARLGAPFVGNFMELSDPESHWDDWKELWDELRLSDPLANRQIFWWHLDAALRVHIESAARASDLTHHERANDPSRSTGITSPLDGIIYDWWQSNYFFEQESEPPSPLHGVGNSLLAGAGIPAPYLRGIAGGLLDVRSAATKQLEWAPTSTDLVDEANPGDAS